ncbi:Dynein light chain roadblock [Podarcis lilfordi]|uniref:Dynein light chain roadblock n=4 Tax=Episquamata TaxID=1329912 RepID=A0AA35PGD2_9SAUR|nr:Dynein light chain roadblock [Podarcis lilfordi]
MGDLRRVQGEGKSQGSSTEEPCFSRSCDWRNHWSKLKRPDGRLKQAELHSNGGLLKRRRPLSLPSGAMAEVEETLKRIQSHKGVIGTIVVNAEGIPIRTTLDNSTTVQYAGLLHQLTMKAKSTVRDIDPQNDLTFLRIRSKKHEIMVAPDKEYLLIVIQNPCE